MPTEIVELHSEVELREAFPVVQELHHLLDERKYTNLLAERDDPQRVPPLRDPRL